MDSYKKHGFLKNYEYYEMGSLKKMFSNRFFFIQNKNKNLRNVAETIFALWIPRMKWYVRRCWKTKQYWYTSSHFLMLGQLAPWAGTNWFTAPPPPQKHGTKDKKPPHSPTPRDNKALRIKNRPPPREQGTTDKCAAAQVYLNLPSRWRANRLKEIASLEILIPIPKCSLHIQEICCSSASVSCDANKCWKFCKYFINI